MLIFIKKNKFYIAAIILFIILYKYGNNMEFYQSSNKSNSSHDQINDSSTPYLDATDDIVLERKDLVQLQNEKIGKFKLDGLDNWPSKSKQLGWWGDHIQAGNGLYSAPKDMVWVD